MSGIQDSLGDYVREEVIPSVSEARQTIADGGSFRETISKVLAELWEKFNATGILASIMDMIKGLFGQARSQVEHARDEALPLVNNARDQVASAIHEKAMPMVEEAREKMSAAVASAAAGVKPAAENAVAE